MWRIPCPMAGGHMTLKTKTFTHENNNFNNNDASEFYTTKTGEYFFSK